MPLPTRLLTIMAFTLVFSGNCIHFGFAAEHIKKRTQENWNSGVHHSEYRIKQIWNNTETGAKRVGHNFENGAQNAGHRLSNEAHHASSHTHKHTH